MDIGTGVAIGGMVLGWAFTLGKYTMSHKKMDEEIKRLEAKICKDIEDTDAKMVRNLEKIYQKLESVPTSPCRTMQGCQFNDKIESRLDSIVEKVHRLHKRMISISHAVSGSSGQSRETTKSNLP